MGLKSGNMNVCYLRDRDDGTRSRKRRMCDVKCMFVYAAGATVSYVRKEEGRGQRRPVRRPYPASHEIYRRKCDTVVVAGKLLLYSPVRAAWARLHGATVWCGVAWGVVVLLWFGVELSLYSSEMCDLVKFSGRSYRTRSPSLEHARWYGHCVLCRCLSFASAVPSRWRVRR